MIYDYCFVDMDDDGACRVRSNAKGWKSASALDSSGEFKKQQQAPPKKYVLPKEWKVVHCYKTCYGARLDEDDITWDMYQKARHLMELSSHKMLPEQDQAPKGIHLWTFNGHRCLQRSYHLRI